MRRRRLTWLFATLLGCSDGVATLEPGEETGFSYRFGDSGDDEPLALASQPSGEFLIVGRFDAPLDLGGGPISPSSARDLFLANYDTEGAHTWSRAVDQRGGSVDLVRARAAASGWWLGGAFYGRELTLSSPAIPTPPRNVGFVALVDPFGEFRWQTALEASGDCLVTDLASHPDGGAWLAGRFFGSLSFARTTTAATARGADVFLARVSARGEPLSFFRYGDEGLDTVTALLPRASGGVWLAGLFEGETRVGDEVLESAGGTDIFLAGIAEDGRVQQLTQLGTPDDEVLSQLALAPNGDLLLAGGLTGPLDLGEGPLVGASARDIFVARFSPALQPRFTRRFSGPDFDTVRGVAASADGRIFVGGTFRGDLSVGALELTSRGDSDGFVVELSALGEVLGARAFGTEGTNEVVADIRPSEDGVVLFAGVEGGADLGFGPLESRGGLDLLVAKLSAVR